MIIRRYEMQPYRPDNYLEQNLKFSIKPLLFTLLILSILAVFTKFQYSTTIAPVKDDAPVDVFSSERAFGFLQHLTKEQVPHPIDTGLISIKIAAESIQYQGESSTREGFFKRFGSRKRRKTNIT